MTKETKAEVKKEKKVPMFCANEQAETEHTLDIDGNGEVILTCDTCGRFTKLPEGIDAKGIKKYIADHNEQNFGQRTIESLENKKTELLDSLDL